MPWRFAVQGAEWSCYASCVDYRDSRPDGGGRFPDTSWGLVLAARDDEGRRSAFSTLCRRYWRPIYACLRRQGFSAADAEDLVQGFFLHLVEHHTIERADPGRGRFRSFLLGALRWFLDNESERERARKRGGEYTFVPIDSAEIEAALRLDTGNHAALDTQFDRQWAHALLRNALRALRAEYANSGQEQTYLVLQPYLDPNNAAVSYATLASRLDSSEGAVKVAVHRLRGRFREALRREVECTVATAREVQDELAHLRDVLDNESLGAV
jgi:RNA polymerase sigma factor (sigma-70 family)